MAIFMCACDVRPDAEALPRHSTNIRHVCTMPARWKLSITSWMMVSDMIIIVRLTRTRDDRSAQPQSARLLSAEVPSLRRDIHIFLVAT